MFFYLLLGICKFRLQSMCHVAALVTLLPSSFTESGHLEMIGFSQRKQGAPCDIVGGEGVQGREGATSPSQHQETGQCLHPYQQRL